jgi:hypothetical protein
VPVHTGKGIVPSYWGLSGLLEFIRSVVLH